MNFNSGFRQNLLWYWLPRGLALMMIGSWMLLVVLSTALTEKNSHLLGGFLVGIVLVLTAMISWKNEPIGGSLYIILGSGYLIFAMGKLFSVLYLLAVIPLYLTGSLFIMEHLHQEKKEQREEDDF